MRKLTTMVLSGFALVTILSLASIANAQQPQSTVDSLTPKYKRQGPCRDPWITIAIGDVFASTHTIQGIGDFGECNPAMYNGGSWSSYAELYRGVKTAFNNMSGKVTITKAAASGGNWRIETDAGSGFKGGQVVSHDGGTLISQDGSNIILNGGGNYTVQSTSTEKRINLGKSVLVIRKN